MFRRGEVYYADLQSNGHVQGGKRPVLILQNNKGNTYSPNLIVCTITSKVGKRQLPTHVKIGVNDGLKIESEIQCESIMTIDKRDIVDNSRVTMLSQEKMEQVQLAVNVSLGFEAKQVAMPAFDKSVLVDVDRMIKERKVTLSGMTKVFIKLCKMFDSIDKNYNIT